MYNESWLSSRIQVGCQTKTHNNNNNKTTESRLFPSTARRILHLMQRIIPRLNQTPRAPCIRRHLPIEQPSQPHLRHKLRLQLHRSRRIIRDKPPIPTRAIRRPELLILMLLSPRPRQIRIIKHPVFTPRARIPLARLAATKERTAVGRDAQEEFLGVDALGEDVGDGGLAGDGGPAGGVIELGLVAGFVGPGAGEVVGHDVEEVEVLCGFGEVDVAEGPLAGWEAGG